MASKEKRRYISYRVDAYLRDKFLAAGRKQKPRACCGGEGVVRFFNHVKFCVVCCASLGQAVAPWMLSTAEVVSVLLIYFLGTSRSLLIHQVPRHYRFSYTHSVEDIVGLSCTRAAILSLSYAVGHHLVHRPYLYTSYFMAATCFPYIVVKTILFRFGHDGLAAATIFTITGLFCWFHILVARRTVEWARRRYQMGLGGFGMPWEEGEDAWLMLKRPDLEDMTKTSDGGGPDAGDDVPPEMLADDDSKFVDLGGLKVHYKEVLPGGTLGSGGVSGSSTSPVGIVLVHGFGAGVFAWRHVMEALAMQCHCRVIAFDRPAFGLTTRPRITNLSNPYTIAAQSDMVLQLCSALGLRQVVLVAHADGCLVTLRAAATSVGVHDVAGDHLQPHLQPPRVVRRTSSITGSGSSTSSKGRSGGPCVGAAAAAALAHASASGAGPGTDHPLSPPVSAGSSSPTFMSASASAAANLDLLHAHAHATGHGYGSAGSGCGAASQVSGPYLEASALMHSCQGSVSGCDESERTSYVSAAAAKGSQLGTFSVGSYEAEAGSMRCDTSIELDRTPTSGGMSGSVLHVPHHRRAQSAPGPPAFSPAGPGEVVWSVPRSPTMPARQQQVQMHVPQVLGLVLLHPSLSGVIGPAFSRILARSKLGRSILRPLLRTEIGDVANRRAWHNADKLTAEVLELYKAPLRVEGWDSALIEITRQRREACQGDLASYYGMLQPLPALIITGQHDRIVPPTKSESLAADMPQARLTVLSDCGHLSHEEAPHALLEQLVPFCGDVLMAPTFR